MKLLYITLILLLLSSCSPKRTTWICVADVDKNSECRIVDCSTAKDICKTGKYRIMKVYHTGYAYVYSLDPPTDMKRCMETVGEHQ